MMIRMRERRQSVDSGVDARVGSDAGRVLALGFGWPLIDVGDDVILTSFWCQKRGLSMQQTAVTEDRRALTFDVAGAANGPAVFLQQGTPCSRLIYGPQAAVAQRLGLRLVSHDRPGYGGSSPLPGRRVADSASDLTAIARHLGISRCAVWGFSGGGPHALACAALAGDLVVAAVVLASISPVESGLDAGNPRMQAVLGDPEGARSDFEAEREMMLRADPTDLEGWLSDALPPELHSELGTFAAYRIESLRSGLATGAEGPFEDQWAFAHPWGFDLGAISIPLRYRHGTLDTDVRPEHGDWITSRLGTAEVHHPEETHISLLLRSAEEDFPWLATHLS
jgi:pimeloyl-ACP methyl ester carboxylesterase